MATNLLPSVVPPIAIPVFKLQGKELSNQFTEAWYSFFYNAKHNGTFFGTLIDTTTPIDGALLVGNASTAQYEQELLAVGSSKLAVTPGPGSLSIDAVEANFTLNNIGGTLSLAKGGTNKSMTAANGGIVYSDADSLELLAPTATASQVLLSGSNTAPNWSTATYPITTTINQILYSSANNTVVGFPTVNSAVLTTTAGGVPQYKTLSANLQFTGTTLNTIQDIQTTSAPTFLRVLVTGDHQIPVNVFGVGTIRTVLNEQHGILMNKTFSPAGTVSNTRGISSAMVFTDTSGQTVTNVIGTWSSLNFSANNTSIITNAHGYFCTIASTAPNSGTLTNVYGYRYSNSFFVDAALCTNAYGIAIDKPNFGTNRYGAYLAGPVGISTTTPTEGLHINDSQAYRRTATAINYVVISTDMIIAVTNTAAPRGITIPAAAATTIGRVLIIKDESGGALINNITITPAGGLIDGAATYVINLNNGVVRLYNSGVNWFTW